LWDGSWLARWQKNSADVETLMMTLKPYLLDDNGQRLGGARANTHQPTNVPTTTMISISCFVLYTSEESGIDPAD
jgi:hypothetical protein